VSGEVQPTNDSSTSRCSRVKTSTVNGASKHFDLRDPKHSFYTVEKYKYIMYKIINIIFTPAVLNFVSCTKKQ